MPNFDVRPLWDDVPPLDAEGRLEVEEVEQIEAVDVTNVPSSLDVELILLFNVDLDVENL